MNEILKKELGLKESTNPLNKNNEIENNQFFYSNNNQRSVDSGKSLKEKSEIIDISLQKENYDEKYTEKNNSDSYFNIKSNGNVNFNIKSNYSIINKKERYKLEQKMKYDLNNMYKEIKFKKISFKNKDKGKYFNNRKKNKYSSDLINEINKNKNYLLKRFVLIEIFLLFLVPFNIILFYILNNDNNILHFYISSLSLSGVLFSFTLFLILLIYLGIFQHYNTSNIFRFLCLINFCISISLLIIQVILIINIKENINFEKEKKSRKILILFLIYVITGIIIIVNPFIGIIAKDSLLIIGGCKNENVCPERRVKSHGGKNKGKYVYFNDEIDTNEININALRKFHACINSNNN